MSFFQYSIFEKEKLPRGSFVVLPSENGVSEKGKITGRGLTKRLRMNMIEKVSLEKEYLRL